MMDVSTTKGEDMNATATTEFQFTELKVTDRCDHCGAQAFVQIAVEHFPHKDHEKRDKVDTRNKVNTVLLFCGHDYRENELLIVANGYRVDDQRSRINQKPSPSSA